MEKSVGQTLRCLRPEKGLTLEEAARLLDIGFSSLAKYERDEQEPPYDRLRRLAKFYGVSIGYLFGERELIEHRSSLRIPKPRPMHAADLILKTENIEDWVQLPSGTLPPADYLALDVVGDAMEPVIRHGDLIIVQRQLEVENGEIAVVQRQGEQELHIRRVYSEDYERTLVPENPAYPPSTLPRPQVGIIGKVVGRFTPVTCGDGSRSA